MMANFWFLFGISMSLPMAVVDMQNYFVNKEMYEETKRRDELMNGNNLAQIDKQYNITINN